MSTTGSVTHCMVFLNEPTWVVFAIHQIMAPRCTKASPSANRGTRAQAGVRIQSEWQEATPNRKGLGVAGDR